MWRRKMDGDHGFLDMLNSFFEKIYCINLVRRGDRRIHAVSQFRKHGIEVEFVTGIDGRNLLPGSMSTGRTGCLLSHLEILRRAQREGLQSFLVLEDDVLFVNDLNKKFGDWKNEMPPEWDMIYLGWLNWLPICYTSVSANVGRIKGVGTTHAVGIKGTVITRLIELMSESKEPVDFYYIKAQETVNAYAFRESLAIQAGFTSDVPA